MSSITKRVLSQLSLVILTLVVLAILFFVGIYLGYVVVGKGDSSEAFKPATWQHILDFVK